MDILDLRILKVITSDKVKGVEFSYNLDHNIFTLAGQKFGRLVVDFLKSFRSLPTRRTLSERYKADEALIDRYFDALEELEYDFNEYAYDLEHAKTRYELRIADEMRDVLNHPSNSTDMLKRVSLKLQQADVVRVGRSHIQKVVGDYLQEFENRYTAIQNKPEETRAIKTRYSLIDNLTGGISPAELFMVGGQTASGKSTVLMNMAIQMWLQGNEITTPEDLLVPGYNVLYFSLEMPYEDCFARFMARMAAVPQRALSDAALDVDEFKRVEQASDFIKKYENAGYYFGIVDVPRNVTIEEVELRYNDALLTYRPDIVVIDYMGLMHSRTFAKDQDFIRMGGIAEAMHEFGRAYNVVVLTAHQLTDIMRNSQSSNEEERKRIGVHRWGRSSLIMHNVNFGLQIETRPNEKVYPDMKIHGVKNRKGPLGQGNLLKDFARATLIDVPIPNDLPEDGVQDIPEMIRRIQGGLQD